MPTESPLTGRAARPRVAPSLDERAAAAAGVSAAPLRAAPPTRRATGATGATGGSGRGEAAATRVILGIDPGTRIVGWGVIAITARGPRLVEAGVVKAGAGELSGRLGTIRRELDLLILRHRPSAVAVEEAFAHKNVQSALRIGEGRGVVLACAGAAGIPVHQYPPATAKKALVGHGAAHKTQVAAMVARHLGLREAPKPLDASDALALALTHSLRSTSAV